MRPLFGESVEEDTRKTEERKKYMEDLKAAQDKQRKPRRSKKQKPIHQPQKKLMMEIKKIMCLGLKKKAISLQELRKPHPVLRNHSNRWKSSLLKHLLQPLLLLLMNLNLNQP